MPLTAQRYGLTVTEQSDERLDPAKATRAAARYLRDLHDRFGSWPLALAAYNGGRAGCREGYQSCRQQGFCRSQLASVAAGRDPQVCARSARGSVALRTCRPGQTPAEVHTSRRSDLCRANRQGERYAMSKASYLGRSGTRKKSEQKVCRQLGWMWLSPVGLLVVSCQESGTDRTVGRCRVLAAWPAILNLNHLEGKIQVLCREHES